MTVFKNTILLILISITTTGCALWPYEKDFDCPIKEGYKCKSLYEISAMADKGMFEPKPINLDDTKSVKKRSKRRGSCNAC
jgi:hypothetical protein